MRLASILCAALLLAGCAHPRSLTLSASLPAPAPAAASFRIAGVEQGGQDVVTDQVSAELAAHGWRRASDAVPAVYVVLASYSAHPAKVGAFVPSGGSGEPNWVAERIPRRPWTLFKRHRRTLSLVVLDAASGRELRRASATLDSWSGSDPEAVHRLAVGAVTALTSPV